jgi:hypothetical protein
MTDKLKNYSFEQKDNNRLDTKLLSLNRDAFLNNIGFSNVQIAKINHPILDKFILHYYANIEWYQQRQKKENKNRKLYNVISVALLVVIPIGVFLLTAYFAERDDATAEAVSSAMAAILTSIFAVHKAISSWMEKRKLNSLFHSAGSKLKTRFYGVEENWHNCLPLVREGDKTIELDQGFLKQLEEAIVFARQVVDEEQLAFYELISFPKIELSNILKSSSEDATSSLASFQSKSFERRVQDEQFSATKQQQLHQWNEERKLRETKVDVLEQELAKLQQEYKAESSEARKKALADAIQGIEKQIDDFLYQNIAKP